MRQSYRNPLFAASKRFVKELTLQICQQRLDVCKKGSAALLLLSSDFKSHWYKSSFRNFFWGAKIRVRNLHITKGWPNYVILYFKAHKLDFWSFWIKICIGYKFHFGTKFHFGSKVHFGLKVHFWIKSPFLHQSPFWIFKLTWTSCTKMYNGQNELHASALFRRKVAWFFDPMLR